MGFETFVRFDPNPLDPRPYAPDAFLRGLDTDPPSVVCSCGPDPSAPTSFEYRLVGPVDDWPAVIVTLKPDGFLFCEYDRGTGTRLFGPLMRYALDHAAGERVVVEAA